MARTNAFPIAKLSLADTVTTLPYQDLHINIHFLRKETTGDRIWFLCTAGFYYKFVKLQGRSGKPQSIFTYSQDHFHQKNGEKKNNK